MTQEEALKILKTGANAFITGEPGSGKTHTIRDYISYLKKHGIEPSITASTGIAATHISGFTIHSWSGIGIRDSLDEYALDKIMQNERTVKRIRSAKVLIIDEISMLSAKTLTMVETVCREIRGNESVFGGMQVILVGDFFQLPPIVNASERNAVIDIDYEESSLSNFAYDSPAWSSLNPIICYLEEQHRQEDQEFLEVLSAIRGSSVDVLHREILSKRIVEPPSDKETTRLFSHNADVDYTNNKKLSEIGGAEKVFEMTKKGSPPLAAQLVKTCLSPEILTLKIGARVMFTKNDPSGSFVNGTIGTVIGFRSDSYPIIETVQGIQIGAEPVEWSIESDNRVLASISQVPLRLAWAITVHKSQGMSLDTAVIDLSKAFEYGAGYVALSRVRTLAGLILIGINNRAYEVHPNVSEKDHEFRKQSEAASLAFKNINTQELLKMQESFIKASGGNVNEASSPVIPVSHKKNTYDETLNLIKDSKNIKEISKKRDLSEGTILTHIEKLLEDESITPENIRHLISIPKKIEEEIHKSFEKVGHEKLTPIFKDLKEKYPYETLRLARITYKQ